MQEQKSFRQYFDNWLYGKNGYYSSYKSIGKEGDFFTSVSTSSFFGGSIAKKIISTIEDGFLPEDTKIVEIGAHHGYLLADIAQFIFTLKPKLLNSIEFIIVEKYEKLQDIQTEYFSHSFGSKIKIKHIDCIENLQLNNAYIIANEIFDSFSCELVYTNNKGILQNAKVINHKIIFENCTNNSILKHCLKYKILKGEVCLEYENFAKILSNNINKFVFLTFDYGELYPRNDFSTRIYSKHNVYPIFDEKVDLQNFFSKSDITYDVHFENLIDSFKKYNIKNESYKTQLKALVEFGIIELLDILHDNTSNNNYLKELNRVKMLLNPTGMGDRFKMALFIKGENDECNN